MALLDLRAEAQAHKPVLREMPHLKEAAIGTWRGRMINEFSSARVFDGLARQFAAAGVHDVVDEVKGFAAEERRHGVLCGAVVEALGGEALAAVPDGDEYPEHDDATPLEAALRNMLSICCLSETVAVSLIGAERIEMPEGELRELLTKIFSDEVGHSRFGWRTLGRLAPALDPALKDRLGDYLEVAFDHLVEHELAHLPASSRPPADGVVLGLCSGSDARKLFFDTVESVIVPGLEAHGIPASRAWSRVVAAAASEAWAERSN
ncbi:MAG: ferritin-like domain-containing protein [Labilithrix sp.]|nr:ferritin-like domain-containing protein [Labilithrix sp.]MCW5810572.1 ferritin-like domain-containing protein [Labilithrix sp.]